MTSTRPEFWTELLGSSLSQPGGVRIQMRVLRKNGRPFLLLPLLPRSAGVTLDLYPAQTNRARIARIVLRCLLRASLPYGTSKILCTVSPEEPFMAFLCSRAGSPAGRVPELGILAGNPATEGRRFLILVLGPHSTPKTVVKAGLCTRARELIDKEHSFLAKVPANTAGTPQVRAVFTGARVHAFAMDFLPGRSHSPQDTATLPALLGSWVITDRKVLLPEIPDWQRLERAAAPISIFPPLAAELRGQTLHPALHHGDFAPWNIKVSPEGAWTALDWERGELLGIPGWDWFHYLIQPAILVLKQPTAELVDRVEALFTSDSFKTYANHAAVLGLERQLFLAYLLHCVQVNKPSEGLAQTRNLLQALTERWHKPS